jgi:hypothetical protein
MNRFSYELQLAGSLVGNQVFYPETRSVLPKFLKHFTNAQRLEGGPSPHDVLLPPKH